MRRRGQVGVTLIELLLAMALSVVVLATLASMVRSAAAANSVTLTQLEYQQQARFAVRRLMMQVRQTKAGTLSSKTDSTSSGSWFSPTFYDLRAGTAAGTLALTENINGVSRIIAEPVTSFSISSPDLAAGQTLVDVAITVGQGDISATATGTARVGGVR